jgi:outer membrane protein OmpA-like peptidoglycan-associated protein
MQTCSKWLLLAAGLAAAGSAAAQTQPLKANEVTEAAITDALAPPVASGPRARGFAPSLKPAKKQTASAAVLITFVTASAELTPESKQALDVVARALRGGKLQNLSFGVEGHADPRGDSEKNLELSRERAESVVAYLVNEHGIDRQRLVPVGKGASEPMNTAQPDAPENRRVTFVTRTN